MPLTLGPQGPSQIYVAGPCEIHVAPGAGLGGFSGGSSGSGNSLYQFLGWSERGVRLSIIPFFDDVPSDRAGSRMPDDVQAMGEMANVSLDLKVFNEGVFAQIASRFKPDTGKRGLIGAGAIGSLMVREGNTYPLLVYPPYVTKPSQNTQIPYHFFAAYLAGPDDIDPMGTRAKKVRVVFRAISLWNSTDGSWNLYDSDATGKPAAA